MKILNLRIAAARKALGISQSELGRRLGLKPQAVQSWEKGNSSPRGADRLQEVAKALGVSVEYLLGSDRPQHEGAEYPPKASIHPDLSPVIAWSHDTQIDEREVSLPQLKEIELPTGSGRMAIQEFAESELRLGKEAIRNKGVDPVNAKCVAVSGNSMEPVLRHGGTVAIDVGCTSIIDGEMYAYSHGGQLRVKQLYRLPAGGIRLRSFNRDEHPDEEYSAQQILDQGIEVLGRVFWSGGFH